MNFNLNPINFKIIKKGKIILSAAAFILTAAAAYAFTRIPQSRKIYGKILGGKCVQSTCYTNKATFASGSGKCHTSAPRNPVVLATGGYAGTYWKATKGDANLGVCTQPTLKWTHAF